MDHEKLYHDFFELCENYQHEATPVEFAFHLLSICMKMCYDLAPNEQEATELINYAMEHGKLWSQGV